MRRFHLTLVITVVALVGAACGFGESTPDEIVLVTHGSFAVSEGVLEAFTEETHKAVGQHRTQIPGHLSNTQRSSLVYRIRIRI